MNPNDYEFLSDFLLNASGLSLGKGKEYLLKARLEPLAKSLSLDGIPDLVAELQRRNTSELSSAVVEAMTTNETSFFRDKSPFDDLRNHIIPTLIPLRATTRRLRIWCAAASTGQEPYSIAMTIRESFPELDSWQIEIVGSDIDRVALKRCEEGTYSQFEIQRGLPIKLLMKYFEQTENGWTVKNELRKWTSWKPLNLLKEYSALGLFDIIFCRNVLIYFKQKTKGEILTQMAKSMRPDGYVCLGAAETMLGICDAFRRERECKSGVYASIHAPATATTA